MLKLGINVHGEGLLKERTFLDSVHSMLSIIREKHALTPIVVISPAETPWSWSVPPARKKRCSSSRSPSR